MTWEAVGWEKLLLDKVQHFSVTRLQKKCLKVDKNTPIFVPFPSLSGKLCKSFPMWWSLGCRRM